MMATVLCDAQGVIYIVHLEKAKCSQSSATLEKRPHLASKKVLFHHYNTLPHTTAIGGDKLLELCTP